MRLKFQKRSELKFASRIIPLGSGEQSRKAEGIIPRNLLQNLFPKLALGFHTRDFYLFQTLACTACLEMASTISAQTPFGMSCPIPLIINNLAPGITRAVSFPPSTGISGSSAP